MSLGFGGLFGLGLFYWHLFVLPLWLDSTLTCCFIYIGCCSCSMGNGELCCPSTEPVANISTSGPVTPSFEKSKCLWALRMGIRNERFFMLIPSKSSTQNFYRSWNIFSNKMEESTEYSKHAEKGYLFF